MALWRILAALCVVVIGPSAWAQVDVQPVTPAVSYSDGTALVSLARSAMTEYLLHRTPAGEIALPRELQYLREHNYAAAVTLRQNGREIGRSICGGGGAQVCRNVVAAALAAMRSPNLPDVVTVGVLKGLTVEVEIIGPLKPIEPGIAAGDVVTAQQVRRSVVPGLTGLKVSRGVQDSYVLPSTAYLEDLSPDQMRLRCMAAIPMSSENARLSWRWSTFATRHFVGYGDGMVVWLYRGKTIIMQEALDEAKLADAAQSVAHWLIANQDKSGMYTVSGIKSTLREHLVTTRAMTLLAQQSNIKGLSSSIRLALKPAMESLTKVNGRTFCRAEDPDDQLAVTALLALTLKIAPGDQASQKTHAALVSTLLASIDAQGRIPARLDGLGINPAAPLPDACLAWLALDGAGLSRASGRMPALKSELEKTPAADPEEALWKLRAGLSDPRQDDPKYPLADFLPTTSPTTGRSPRGGFGQHGLALPDELGGFAAANDMPRTDLTALAALDIANSTLRPRLSVTQPQEVAMRQVRQTIWQARCFCYMMMFHRHEAYFARSPNLWIGAVRQSPASARVTLGACAWAIEAFLIKQSPLDAIE